jgi:hypothetical protein
MNLIPGRGILELVFGASSDVLPLLSIPQAEVERLLAAMATESLNRPTPPRSAVVASPLPAGNGGEHLLAGW